MKQAPSWLRSWFGHRASNRRRRRDVQLGCEPLEDRTVPTGIVGLLRGLNQIVQFDSAAPATILSTTTVTGLVAGDTLRAIDFRPADGVLYGLGISSSAQLRLYTINPTTGAATARPNFVNSPVSEFWGMSFNPVTGQIRVVNDEDVNLRLNPLTGARADTPVFDLSLSGSSVPIVDSIAYTNPFPGATTTTLFAVNLANNQFARVGGVDGVPSANDGLVTNIGPLGVAANNNATGLDVDFSGAVFASMRPNAGLQSLFTINPATGAATLAGLIGTGANSVDSIAVIPPKNVNLIVTIAADEDDGNTSAGDLSLREALRLANFNPNLPGNKDTITFAPALAGQTISLTMGSLPISSPVNIVGPGAANFKISGNDQSRIFTINDNSDAKASVSISGLTLTDGAATSGGVDGSLGGAILNRENLTLSNMIIHDNDALGGGGGIYNDAAVLTITNSTISGNLSTNNSGGGIFVQGGAGNLTTITGTTISGNLTPNGHGGGIASVGGKVVVVNSTFASNVAQATGGGIVNAGGILAVSGSNFSGNSSANGSGGGIHSNANLSVANSTFTSNVAHLTGGGIEMVGGLANVTNSTLSGNSSFSGGGGILQSGGTFTLTNSVVKNNSADDLGGGVRVLVGSFTATNSTFTGNSCTNGAGGAINNSSTVSLTDCLVSANTSDFGGGIINGNGAITLTNTTIANNVSSVSGGGVANISGTLTLQNSTISGNTAAGVGGGIHTLTGSVIVDGSTISGNSAIGGSGADGGGISNFDSLLRLTNSTISGNSATGSGGGIHNDGGFVTTFNCTIVANRANTDNTASTGGGIFTNNNAASYTKLVNTIVAGNTSGGATPTPNDLPLIKPVDPESHHNLIGDPDTAGGLTHAVNDNILGKPSLAVRVLFPLAEFMDPTLRNNGGPTLTHALTPGAAASDKGGLADNGTGSEVQTVALTGTLPNNFTLTFNGQTTTSLSSTATGAQVAAALNLLSTINGFDGSVTVTKANNTFTVTFGGTLVNTDVPLLTGPPPGALVVTVTEATKGRDALFDDQRGAGFKRTVAPAPDIGAFETPRSLFFDTFDRPNNVNLGFPWAKPVGALGIVNDDRAQGTGTTTVHLAAVAGLVVPDVDVSANVAIDVNQQGGIIARYAGVGDKNYYYASVTRDASGIAVGRIIRNVNGVNTVLAAVEGLPSQLFLHALRFRVVGSTLQLFNFGTLVATAQDSTFKSGIVGMRTLGTTNVNDFRVLPVATGLKLLDSFQQPDNTLLNEPWANAVGFYRTIGGKAQGGQALNLAYLNGVQQADVDLLVSVGILGAGHQAALIARYQGVGDKNHYMARLVRTATGFTAQISKNVNGVFTLLGTKSLVSSTGQAELRFLVTGANLRLFVNNVAALDVLDTTFTTGSVGIRSDGFATFDDFHSAAVTTDAPFSDVFTQTDSSGLGVNWTRRRGNFKILGNAAVGASVAPAVDLATLVGVKARHFEVQANVALTTTGHQAGLLGAYTGPGDANYYMVRVVKVATGFNLSLVKNVAGVFTVLKSQPTVPVLTGLIKLQVIGTSIKVHMGGVEQTQLAANDSSLDAGSVGIRSVGTGTIDNFSATVFNFNIFVANFDSPPPPPLPPLDPNFVVRAGSFAVNAGKLIGTAALNLVTQGRSNVADVEVQADINVSNFTLKATSLVARYSGPGDNNMYFAQFVAFGQGAIEASIFKKVNGVVTKLASMSVIGGPGLAKFNVVGGLLKLSFEDVLGTTEISVFDFSLKSGSTGIRMAQGATVDNFSTTELT